MKPPAGTHLYSFEAEHYEWDPVTRIEVSNIDLVKGAIKDLDYSMIGTNQEFYGRIKKFFSSNNNAGAWAFYFDGDLNTLKGIEETLYSSAYQVTPVSGPKVLVIGVGAGMDILTGLYFNASQITGVEINGATHKLLRKVYKDYFRHWVTNPQVELVHDEGRHFLSKSNKHYDIIQLTGVDTYSGTMASANIFSESYLYTKEAVKLYWERLSENGIINIIRLEYRFPPREILRMLTTVVKVLRESGISEPDQHVAIITNKWLSGASLLIKKTPFHQDEIQRLKDWAHDNPYLVFVTTPDLPENEFRVYQTFLEQKSESKEKSFILNYPMNILPAEDDLPFFFRYTRWMDLFRPGIPFLELNIVFLLSILTMISWLFIRLPMKYLVKTRAPLPNKYRYGLIFACLGLGYLFIEIAFMQKFGLFLGHPNYAISVVLASLLMSTGLGALYSRSIIQRLKNARYTVYCLASLILLEYIVIFPNLQLLIGMNIYFKAVVTLILIFPVALLLGVYLPQAVEQLKRISPQYVPWGWGINGIFSVISPILAMAISVTFGINFLLLCSIPFYLIAGYFLGEENI